MERGESSLKEMPENSQHSRPSFMVEQPIPGYSNETLVKDTRDMVKTGQLPNVEIGELVANAFRDTVQYIMNGIDSGLEDSRAPGQDLNSGAYSGVRQERGIRSDQNDQQRGQDQAGGNNSHNKDNIEYSKRNPYIPRVPASPDHSEWVNRHPEQHQQNPEERRRRSEEQRSDRVPGRNPDRTKGRSPDKVLVHEDKPPANPKPEPPLTCEDLEKAGGKIAPSKLPPRSCPEYYSTHPVRPR